MNRFARAAFFTCMIAGPVMVVMPTLVTPAWAAQAAWSASNCGHEPSPPAVESSSVERYNSSIDKVGAYDKAARAYSGCVSKEAVAEQSAISNDARVRMAAINNAASAVQKRIAGNFGALSGQLRAAGQKLGAKN